MDRRIKLVVILRPVTLPQASIKEDRGIYLMDMSGDLSRRASKHGKHSRRKSKVETPSSLTIIELAISTPASSLFRQDVCSVQHITTTSVF